MGRYRNRQVRALPPHRFNSKSAAQKRRSFAHAAQTQVAWRKFVQSLWLDAASVIINLDDDVLVWTAYRHTGRVCL